MDPRPRLWTLRHQRRAGEGLLHVEADGGGLVEPEAIVLEGRDARKGVAFDVSNGTLDIDAPGFETSGTLTFTGGTIDCDGLSGSEVAKFTGS